MTMTSLPSSIALEMIRDNDRPVHLGFTRPKLEAAFNRVADAENWKLPICKFFERELSHAEAEAIKAAVAFYTGETPTVSNRGNGTLVTGRGYYLVIGA